MQLRTPGLLLALTLASQASWAETLAEIYELAIKNDPQLKAAEAEFKANQETEVQAKAGLLPNVGFQYSYVKTDADVESVSPNFSGGSLNSVSIDSSVDTSETGYTLSLQQKLFDLSTWYTFKSGQQLSDQAKAKFAADQQDLIVRTAVAYFNVLRAIDNLASSRAQEAAIARQKEQTQQRFDVGLIAITDVHEATAAHDLAVVKRLADENALGVAYEALSVLTGQPHNSLWYLKDNFPASKPTPANAEDWAKLATDHNSSLKASRSASEAALQNARAAKAGHMPTVTGTLAYADYDTNGDSEMSYMGQSGTLSQDAANQATSIRLDLNVPLYSGGYTSSKSRQAYQQYNQSKDGYTSLLRNTVQATRSLYLTVTTDAARVAAQKQSITSSQSALDATKAGYDVGTRNVVDVLTAQQNLYAARRDYANARYDYVIDSLKLQQQAGTLSPKAIYDLNQWLQADAPSTMNSPESESSKPVVKKG